MIQGPPEKFQIVHSCTTRGSIVALSMDFEENTTIGGGLLVNNDITVKSSLNTNTNLYIRNTTFSSIEFF